MKEYLLPKNKKTFQNTGCFRAARRNGFAGVMENNPDIRAAAYRVTEAAAILRQTGADRYPSVNFSAQVVRLFIPLSSLNEKMIEMVCHGRIFLI